MRAYPPVIPGTGVRVARTPRHAVVVRGHAVARGYGPEAVQAEIDTQSAVREDRVLADDLVPVAVPKDHHA